jgi:hypothetical protein
MLRRPLWGWSWPPEAAQIDAVAVVKHNALVLEQLALEQTSCTDPALRVDNTLPGDLLRGLLGNLVQSLANCPGLDATAYDRGNVAICTYHTAGDLLHYLVDPQFEYVGEIGMP